jgi:hypothetical protein
MTSINAIWKRALGSAVIWSWVFNGFRLASGLIVLPLLLRELPEAELGMYYVFLNLIAFVPIIDFGLSVSVGRHVSYAMGGATSLKAHGVGLATNSKAPNYSLLWQLLQACHRIYRILALLTLLLLGLFGTFNVGLNAADTAWPAHTWAAWALTLTAATFDMYLGWWNVFLRGMNQVVLAARLAVLGYGLQIAIASVLLLNGAGLLSVPIGSLTGNLLQRFLSRRACLKLLGDHPSNSPGEKGGSLLKVIWPNTWRVGLQFLSVYLGVRIPGLVFAGVYGAAAFAEYGVSLQVMTICSGMAMVWTVVKWPLVGQYRTQQDYARLQRLLQPRVWLQSLSFLVMALFVVLLGPQALSWIGSDKSLLPTFWLSLLALNAFLELQFSFWTTLLSTENRIPSLWPTVATNAFSLVLFAVLLFTTNLHLGALVLAPLLAGLLFNYWYWPFAGARNIRTSLGRFLFCKPRPD